MIRAIANRIHRFLARSTLSMRCAITVRNQMNCIIRYHLGEDSNGLLNGESWLVDVAAPDCRSFVDVGANLGVWSRHFLSKMPLDGRGLLIDAATPVIAILRERFSAESRVKIIHSAVSDCVGVLPFYEEESAGETSSLLAGYSNSSAKLIEVAATTIDAELAKSGFSNCDFLKIDAEGFDFHVIRGATEALASKSIGIVQFEYNSPWAKTGSTLFNAIRYLGNYGYEVYLLQSTGLHNLNYERYGEYFGYSNFVALSPIWNERLMPNIGKII